MRPEALQSKTWIARSFFDLLSVKPLSVITISEITENAELDRRTFYRHFKTKEDVISYSIQEASKLYVEVIGDNTGCENYVIAKAFFEVCVTIKETLLILYKHNLLHMLLADFNHIFTMFQEQFAGEEELQMENREYLLAYNIGGFWNLMIKWLADDCRKSPDQMAEIVKKVFQLQTI